MICGMILRVLRCYRFHPRAYACRPVCHRSVPPLFERGLHRRKHRLRRRLQWVQKAPCTRFVTCKSYSWHLLLLLTLLSHSHACALHSSNLMLENFALSVEKMLQWLINVLREIKRNEMFLFCCCCCCLPGLHDALELCNDYIKAGSDMQINLSSSMRKDILALFEGDKLKALQAGTTQITGLEFDLAYEEVLSLLSQHCWPGFRSNNLFSKQTHSLTHSPITHQLNHSLTLHHCSEIPRIGMSGWRSEKGLACPQANENQVKI